MDLLHRKSRWHSFQGASGAPASRSEIVGEHNGALRVRLVIAPVDGANNEALIRILALAFKVLHRAVL
ncbi:MAG: DUF167 family protein [Acidobacteria bacterium]|nr:DUF167 family protein [Acidobacteriota bacterium]